MGGAAAPPLLARRGHPAPFAAAAFWIFRREGAQAALWT